VVLQCIGDVNQAILSDNKASAWQPGPDAIDLDETMRFGAKIAMATSGLTVHRPQVIRAGSGAAASADQLYLLIYGEGRETQVGPRFAALIVEQIGADCNAWAVAHRRNANAQSKTRQTTLLSYFPEFAGPAPLSTEPNLCRVLQRWRARLEPFSAIDSALHVLLQGQPLAAEVLSGLSSRHCLRRLGQYLPNAARCLRSWIATIDETAFADAAAWESAVDRLGRELAAEWPLDQAAETSRTVLSFSGQMTEGSRAAEQEQVVYRIGDARVTLKVGTVAGIKGQTHDATLYLATTLNRMRTGEKLAKASAAKSPVDWGPQEKLMLANMFVAFSRPRHIAACAVPAGDLKDSSKALFVGRGWQVVEV
jgi:DNA helicase II / ATP-dependent DNA helicase PcrA